MDADLDDADIQAAIAASLGHSVDFQGEWICGACTILNDASATKCHVCDTLKEGYGKDDAMDPKSVCKNGHLLVYQAMTNKNAVCDLCDRRLVEASATFRCASCDYDTCWACHVDGQNHMTALCDKLHSEIDQDRSSGPCPIAPHGPLGSSLIHFLQIFLPRRDAARRDENEICVQFRCVQQHNDASCGYYSLYHAKVVLDVIKARSETAAMQSAAALRNGDRALEFVKVLHASLRRQKPDVQRVDLERWDAAELVDSHDSFRMHKDDITLILDPLGMEPLRGGPANPSMVELDMKLSELRNGQITHHVFCFGAGGHYLTLVAWASRGHASIGESAMDLVRDFELILLDSENRLNFQDAGNYKGLNDFVCAVSACLRDGSSFIALEFQEAAERLIFHTNKAVEKEDGVILEDCLDNVGFVREALVILDRMCSLKGLFQFGESTQVERLRPVLQSLLVMVKTHVYPATLRRAQSSARLLPLKRTESGTLWAQQFNDRLRELASDLVEVPADLVWPPPVSQPPRDMVRVVVACSFDRIDSEEAMEFLLAIAHLNGRRDTVTLEDQERATSLLLEESKHRQKCHKNHDLHRAKREKAHCSSCKRDQVLTSYLCRQPDCTYLCCESCYNRNRGSVLQACLRALTGTLAFKLGDEVRVGDTIGKISDCNGRAYKVLGNWYHQDEVEEASLSPAGLAEAAALGLKRGCHVINPGEHSRAYSSIFGDNAIGAGHARSMLNSAQAWSAKINQAGEWMKIDLGNAAVVVGVVTQGRQDAPCDNQFVTKFEIQFSISGKDWIHLPGMFLSGYRGSEVKFNEEFRARYIKFVVKEWQHHISMRAGVLVKSDIRWSSCSDASCFPGQDAEQMPAIDIVAVKKHAINKGYEAFVLHQDVAYFRRQTAQECFSSLTMIRGAVTHISTKVAV